MARGLWVSGGRISRLPTRCGLGLWWWAKVAQLQGQPQDLTPGWGTNDVMENEPIKMYSLFCLSTAVTT